MTCLVFLVILMLGLLAAPLAAEAQQAKIWRIAVLGGSPPTTPAAASSWGALRQGLRELGYVEGQNLVIEWRFAEGRAERYHELAAEIVALKPDVIVAAPTPSVSAAKRATSTIPIVMVAGDPVGTGLVASLARPGANITGMSGQNPELAGKRLELLKEAFPGVSRVGLLLNTTLPQRDFIWRDLQSAALAIGVKLQLFEVRGPEDFERGLRSKLRRPFRR